LEEKIAEIYYRIGAFFKSVLYILSIFVKIAKKSPYYKGGRIV